MCVVLVSTANSVPGDCRKCHLHNYSLISLAPCWLPAYFSNKLSLTDFFLIKSFSRLQSSFNTTKWVLRLGHTLSGFSDFKFLIPPFCYYRIFSTFICSSSCHCLFLLSLSSSLSPQNILDNTLILSSPLSTEQIFVKTQRLSENFSKKC